MFENSQASKGVSEGEALFGSWHLYAWVGGILVINFVVMGVVRCRMKRQMRNQMNSSVSEAVSSYFALSGQETL